MPDVDPAVRQAAQMRELLRVRPAVGRDAGGQLAARRTGEQQFLAEVGLGDRLQVEISEADQVGDPVPFGFAGGPCGGLVAALAGRTHGLVAAQPRVPADGACQVDPGEQVGGPAEWPGGDRRGDPPADSRGDRGGLGRGQPRIRGLGILCGGLGRVLLVPPPRSARRARQRRGRDAGDDAAGDAGGVHDPCDRPGEQPGAAATARPGACRCQLAAVTTRTPAPAVQAPSSCGCPGIGQGRGNRAMVISSPLMVQARPRGRPPGPGTTGCLLAVRRLR